MAANKLPQAAPFGHCTYCNRALLAPGRAKRSKTRDHVMPKSAGGRKTVLACRHCNNLKGDFYPEQWQRIMADHPQWWSKFHTRTDLLKAEATRRNDLFHAPRVSRIQPAWPTDVFVPLRPLFRLSPTHSARGW